MNAAGTLFPNDADKDGISDGLEFYLKTNPHDPARHPPLEFFVAHTFGLDVEGHGLLNVHYCLVPRIGKRLSVCGAIEVARTTVSFPPDFWVRIIPPRGVRLGLPEAPLVANELLVPVSHDGVVKFDCDLPEATAVGPPVPRNMEIMVASTGEMLADLPIYAIRADPEIAPSEVTVEDVHAIRIRWPRIEPPAEEVLIEESVDAKNAEWHPLCIGQAGVTQCRIDRIFGTKNNYYLGRWGPFDEPLKFRVTPIRWTGLFSDHPNGQQTP